MWLLISICVLCFSLFFSLVFSLFLSVSLFFPVCLCVSSFPSLRLFLSASLPLTPPPSHSFYKPNALTRLNLRALLKCHHFNVNGSLYVRCRIIGYIFFYYHHKCQASKVELRTRYGWRTITNEFVFFFCVQIFKCIR